MYDSVVFHVLLSLCFKFDSIVLIILFLNFILFCTALGELRLFLNVLYKLIFYCINMQNCLGVTLQHLECALSIKTDCSAENVKTRTQNNLLYLNYDVFDVKILLTL